MTKPTILEKTIKSVDERKIHYKVVEYNKRTLKTVEQKEEGRRVWK